MGKPFDFHTRYDAEIRRDTIVIWVLVAVLAAAVLAPLAAILVGSWLHVMGDL